MARHGRSFPSLVFIDRPIAALIPGSNVTVALSGVAVNCAAGTAAAQDDPATLVGATANTNAGTLVASPSLALPGAAVNASAGTAAVSSDKTATGAAVNASAGTATASVAGGATLSGAAVNASAGSPAVALALTALAGDTANTAAGTITVASTAVTAALSGAAANVHAGNPSVTAVQLPAIFYDTTYVPPTGATINADAVGGFQAALNLAIPGQTIVLTAGSNYVGVFTLPNKVGSTDYIHIRSSATMTTEGIRITPAQAVGFPKIATPDNSAAIQAAAGASYYRFINIDFVSASTPINGYMIGMGTGSEQNLSDFPHHIIVDRCAVRGHATNGGRRGVMFAGSYQAVIDSHLSDWKEVGADTQAIACWTGGGPYKIVNNYCEAAGENILFGGADVYSGLTNLSPSDIEIRNNHCFKPLSWKTDDPSYAGTHWTVKNSFELKHAKRVLVDGNLFENCWGDSQNGYCVLFTVRNQGGTNPWAIVSDVTFRNNEIRNSLNGINMLGQDNEASLPSQVAARLYIHHNLMTGIGTGSTTQGIAFLCLGSATNGYQDVEIDHNTCLHTGSTIVVDAAPWPRFKFTNNICQHNVYGIIGTGQNPGLSTTNVYFPSSTITKNAFATPSVPGWGPPTAADGLWYPAGNTFPVNITDIGFINYPTDLRLSATSPYQDIGTDGLDIGYAETAAGVVITQPYTLISHTAAASTNDVSVTTTGIDTTGANLIVLATAEDDSSVPVASDSKANIYTKLTTYGGGTGFVPRVTLWYCFNPNVGPGHTFSNNPTGPTAYPSIAVAAFSGANTTPFDLQNGASSGNTGVVTIQPGSITPSSNGELVMTAYAFGTNPSSSVPLITGGFTVTDWADDGAHSYGVAMAYLIQDTSAAANPTWSHGTLSAVLAASSIAAFEGVTVAVFKAAWAYSCNELIGV